MKDRVVRRLEILSANKKVKTNLLAEMLDVSFVTVRKDLDVLEKRGIVSRTHGYVSFDGVCDTGKRMAVNYSVKRKIVQAAALIIEEGETVMIESGSCCALLAEELGLTKKDINIVTNSIFILNYISKFKNISITILGGHLQPKSQVLTGDITKKCAELICAEKLFIGTDGFIPEYGFTGRNRLCAEITAEFVNHAKEVYILTESSKFNSRGAYKLLKFDKLAGVFTDNGIPKDAEAVLKNNNVRVFKVPV